MSDSEDAPVREEEEEEQQEEEAPAPVQEAPAPRPPPKKYEGGKSETEMIMEEKRIKDKERMEAEILEYEEMRKEERERMEQEIEELRTKREQRKVERIEEERKLAELRAAEEQRRKAEEEERQRKKREEAEAKMSERMKKQQEAEERAKNMGKRSFTITKKSGETTQPIEHKEDTAKSKEQLEAEKRAILEQRIQPLSIAGMNADQLRDKAKELHAYLSRLVGDKYDLEQHFKSRNYEMMELAERARQMNKGKKKVAVTEGASATMDDKHAGAPPKIQLCSKYERHTDRRSYGERKVVFAGPNYAEPVARILPGEGAAAAAGGGGGEEGGEAGEEEE